MAEASNSFAPRFARVSSSSSNSSSISSRGSNTDGGEVGTKRTNHLRLVSFFCAVGLYLYKYAGRSNLEGRGGVVARGMEAL